MPSWSWPLVGPGLAVDLSRPIDLSLAIAFDPVPVSGRAFGLPAPTTAAVVVGAFVGDVRRGGSCNCETHVITPHGDGTHTEGVGHLLHDRVSVLGLVDAGLMPVLVVTVVPLPLQTVDDDVVGNHAPDDQVVDELSLRQAVERAMHAAPAHVTPKAIVVRTAAGEQQRSMHLNGTRPPSPPYFTIDAAAWVLEAAFEHLLTDLPSLDRADDGGLLGAHRTFFDVPARAVHIEGAPPRRTVTELVAVDAHVADGLYALSLQLAPLVADAVPSRPVLFPLIEASPTWLRS